MILSLHVLIDVALKGALLLGLGTIITALMRRRSAAARHAVWACALAGTLAVPVVSAVLPAWNVAIPETLVSSETAAPEPVVPVPRSPSLNAILHSTTTGKRVSTQPVLARSAAAVTAAATIPVSERHVVSSQPAQPRSWWQQLRSHAPLTEMVLLVWLTGMVLAAARFLVGSLRARRVLSNACVLTDDRWASLFRRTKAQMRLHRHVVLLRSESVTTPAAWGVFHPVVIMTVAADQWSDEQRRTVLLHEFAHVERWDCLTHAVAEIACAVHWFNPLAWWAKHQLYTERERACDDRVLGHGMPASSYAEQLMTVAYSWQGWHGQPAGALPMSNPSQLEDRIRRILDRALQRGANTRALTTRLGSVAACLILPLAALHPRVAHPSVATANATANSTAPVARPVAALHAASDTLISSTNDVQWTGALPSGDTIAIANLVGDIRAEPAQGNRVEIVAQRHSERDDPKTVQIHIERHDHKVSLCSVYPTQTSQNCDSYNFKNNADHCDGSNERGHEHCGSDVKVDWVLRVPAGVRLSASTVSGNVSAARLGSDVAARSVGGRIDVFTTGHVAASTLGPVNVSMGSTDWHGDLEIFAGGGLTVTLPANSNTALVAVSAFGRRLQSDFPLHQGDRGSFIGIRAAGTLGSGGRSLHLRTLGGKIAIRNAAVEHSTQADNESSVGTNFDTGRGEVGEAGDVVHLESDPSQVMIDSRRIKARVHRAIAEARAEARAGSGAGASVDASVTAALAEVDIPGTVAASIRAARIGETVDSEIRSARIGETIDAAMRAAFGESTWHRSRPTDKTHP